MPLKAGTRKKGALGYEDQYEHSMAAAMEYAFRQEWPVIMGSSAPDPNEHMRLLFIAIAQGVVKHLKNNAASITINVPSGGGINIGTSIDTEHTVLY